ncbi:MAG: septum formation inhibitor Maf [Firmicutes bacterium]|nr:septum formation inhibitor Maf [Bacillota bacterium]
MSQLILASASPRRAELLRQLGLNFTVMASCIAEEEFVEATPEKLVRKLALQKGESVAARVAQGIIIAADTIVEHKGQILGKPATEQQARAMIKALSGDAHHVFTGLAVIRMPQKLILTDVVKTTVFMRKITEQEIDWYISSGEPFDKAGGYGIQGKAAVFVEKLEGCYFNVVGLPLAALWKLLADAGFSPGEGAG